METIDWGMVKKSTKDSSSSINQNLSEAAMNWKVNKNKWTLVWRLCLKTHPNEKVDHEKNVEGEIDLLGGVLCPSCASLHSKAENKVGFKDKKIKWMILQPGGLDEVDDQGGDRKDKSDPNLMGKK